MLAGADVARIAMVCCPPASVARVARIRGDGGDGVAGVRLIDAFLWSARIELVATFCRPPRALRRRVQFGA
jgi:tRNA/tmRNA/rRNA uracil-C5-methylase (TrmA/RlmC/RlmD family)